VGGNNRLAMADLRRAVGGLGHREVATYLQSGNVVFSAARPGTPDGEIAGEMEDAIAAELGVRLALVVLGRDELRSIAGASPFPGEADPRLVHVVFLPSPAGPGETAAVAAAVGRAHAKGSLDEAQVAGRAVHMWTPGGMGRSRLVVELARGGEQRTATSRGTARNWATVTALAGLLDG
jgi:uncharacterized protein (DUF1697 family)